MFVVLKSSMVGLRHIAAIYFAVWPLHLLFSECSRLIFIRLEARLQPNIGNTLRHVWMVFTRSDDEPIWIKSWALWVGLRCRGLALADFGCDPRSSESGRQAKFCFFCQINNARFYPFPVGQISRNLHTTRRSVSRWNLSERFQKCSRIGSFSKKTQKIGTFSKSCDFREAAITPQWLQSDENSLPSDPSVGCLVSISTVGINANLFPWPLDSAHGTYSKLFYDVHRTPLTKLYDAVSRRGLMTSSAHGRYLI